MLNATIVANCGKLVGLGHLRRTLVLAEALRDRSIESTFYLPDNSCTDIIKEYNFQTELWPHNLLELPPSDIVVTDSYQISIDVQKAWNTKFRCNVLIDDVADREIDVDIIVNCNLYADYISYNHSQYKKILLGPLYSLLRPELFKVHRAETLAVTKRVVISFGGSDDGSYSFPIAKALLETIPNLEVNVVVAPMHQNKGRHSAIANEHLYIHYNPDMVTLMSSADLYIGAVGVTLLEAIVVGTPFVVVKIADNQQIMVDWLSDHNVSVCSSVDIADILPKVIQALAHKAKHNDIKEQISPMGPYNVADEIIAFLG